jgi:hypothetical protein
MLRSVNINVEEDVDLRDESDLSTIVVVKSI